ncbi:MAG: pyridoxal phosphate-dependent aminotransferase family protein [Acidobacteria bacterium]|uniref:Pyridoxal phosphate-dependent aminotransferase family protein n=1 Tax=Candidatus Sulfomarinibacter kjeldsenii TaxID=2885994 RepID=A0A8J6Y957_9BACT|nr:pyridoxal phosphate-dependent aminotransferase family protein [Candidatus Sulfomarinibacter kjeldsenii]MBD3870839.1 pyridoxal phosphate-dependent aminotransferase family protein [Candidatus Sulfomarinibacter kjeldsenii]
MFADNGVNVDVFQKCFDFKHADAVRDTGLYPYFRTISSGQDPVVTMDGQRVIMLGSNNYLGLTNHPEVKQAAAEALESYGTGTAGSRFLNGTLDIHVELEEKLAQFMGSEAALTFSTGFAVNLGVISSLIGRKDVVILDNLDHACILDGARLSFGRVLKYPHNDMDSLEERLRSVEDQRSKMIVVDGVFSMEGDLADLPRIVELKNKFNARLMVDDAHGVGVMGEHGRGTMEHFGLENEADLVMGTFSKSLAAVGGYVVGDSKIIDFIKHNARSLMFSAAPPPASVASVIKAIEIIEREPERRQRLWDHTDYMKHEFSTMGYDTGDSASPVIPLVVGEDMAAYKMTRRLQEEGVFVNPVVSPAVPEGRALMRTSYMATHTRDQLDSALEAFRKVGREMGIIG